MGLSTRSAYLAGIIDADGHVSWRGDKNNTVYLGVTNTSAALMAWLRAEIGGSVSLQRATCPPDCPDAPNHYHRRTDIFRWHVMGERAAIVLRAIRPFLVIKGERADEALGQWYGHLAVMQRPSRRRHHIEKEREAMRARGWD